MRKKNKSISIRLIISIIFVIALLLSTSSISFLILYNWYTSADETTDNFSRRISDNIYEKINDLMHVPEHINEVNYQVIEGGLLDLTDTQRRDTFFVGVLSAHRDEIYSFSYGTANGEYYGARRNEKGIIEIMRNDITTGGESWYYTVNDDLTAGERVVQAGLFDPRTRDWYQAAATTGGPTLSPVYKHFVMDDLTISAAWPVYNRTGDLQGVLGAHMLLSGIGTYLTETVREYQGFAFIIENETGELIASSTDLSPFSTQQDGSLKRLSIDEINSADIQQAYREYQLHQQSFFSYESDRETFYANARDIQQSGIGWTVISAIPQSLLMARVTRSIYWTVFLVIAILIVSFLIYIVVTRKYLRPIDHLLQVSESLSSGDLSQRVTVVRKDEIGIISQSFNQVADKMQFLINHLEQTVQERTDVLNQTNEALGESNSQLQLILNSTADGIYGIDLDGNCTFCNVSCLRLLGYDHQSDLLGQNMHRLLHHSYRGGAPFPIEKCKIYRSIIQGKGFEADDEVFWKADGTAFDVEYHAYPQIRNDAIIGGVITFIDITERKERDAEIRYLNEHDPLTGLHNRRYLEAIQHQVDTPDHLPLTVIFADINGLKLTNDIFGHAAGDELIRKSSEILQKSCRDHDIIARIGGDEFIILLPATNHDSAMTILERIRGGFQSARVAAIKCSISLGVETKTNREQSLEEVMSDAENAMYRDKALNRKSTHKGMIDTLVETLHAKRPREQQHSAAVSKLCADLGTALHLPEPEIAKLKRAGYLHDIGKIILDEKMLAGDVLTDEELEEMQQHTVVGYRILNLFDETLDLAEYIYSHHERWDGQGYPRGLEGEQIPLLSRIISIVESYERALQRGELSATDRKKAALDMIRQESGTRFDPDLVEVFAAMEEEN